MPQHYEALPEYAKPDLWLDERNCLEFVRWKQESEPYMARWWHKTPSDEGWCAESFAWRTPDPSFSGRALWELQTFSPLTVSPSLLCLDCGAHGFIRDGKWDRIA